VGRDARRARLADDVLSTDVSGPRHRVAAVCLVALAMAATLATTASKTRGQTAAGPATVALSVAFDRNGRLGSSTAIAFDLRVDARRAPAAMTDLTVRVPAGVDFATSGLGIATCRPAQRDVLDVLARGHDLRPCPANAVLGHGEATAAIYYSDEQTVAASGAITLYNGPPVGNRPGVVAYVRTQHPIRSQLVYAGGLFNAPRPFGLGMRLTLPALPNSPFGAPISVARLTFDLGGEDIVYYESIHGRRVKYRPGGLAIPEHCPRGGFRFRATVGFADGSARSGGATVPCPPRADA
jgi:hypothetical protein